MFDPSTRDGYNSRLNVKTTFTGFISEFSFFYVGIRVCVCVCVYVCVCVCVCVTT